jgi:hypothetical protein
MKSAASISRRNRSHASNNKAERKKNLPEAGTFVPGIDDIIEIERDCVL